MLLNFYLIVLTGIISFSQPGQQKIKAVDNRDKLDSVLLGKIKTQVAAHMNAWFVKGEFEKTDSFQYRIRERGTAEFQDACFEAIYNSRNWDRRNFTIALKEYNADEEYFNVDLRYKDQQWKNKLFVPLANAKTFRDSFDLVKTRVSGNLWGVYKGSLHPKYIFLEDNRIGLRTVYTLPIKEFSDVFISTDDIALSKPLSQPIDFSLYEFQAENFGIYDAAPEFPGGQGEWVQYLAKTLNPDILKRYSKSEKINVVISFVVDRDGSISSVELDKDPGSGIGAEIIRVVKRSPIWRPAIVNDHMVRGLVKQSIPISIPQ
jgi:hypothetical protein